MDLNKDPELAVSSRGRTNDAIFLHAQTITELGATQKWCINGPKLIMSFQV